MISLDARMIFGVGALPILVFLTGVYATLHRDTCVHNWPLPVTLSTVVPGNCRMANQLCSDHQESRFACQTKMLQQPQSTARSLQKVPDCQS